ncbi:hypothetical protein Tco_0526622 [Tanacetum coccineum]
MLYMMIVPQKELSDEQKYFPSSFISFEDPLSEISLYSSSETKPTPKSMPSANLILVDLNQMENDFQKLFELLETASKRRRGPLIPKKKSECVDNNSKMRLRKFQRDSIEIQKGMQKHINILENDVQRCQKQSLDFELQLQHEREKRKCKSSLKSVCETSWISKMETLESENVSLDSKVQSLIKERNNVKTEYKKLFNSIKKTRTQSQGEVIELDHNLLKDS